jgi:ribonuclease T2
LSLSWSPSFCEAAGERGAPPQQQCAARPYSFVVHGLWPQYEHGFPEFCQVPAPRLDRNIVSSMLDLMPAPRLIFQQWDKHGTCSGLSPAAYFETVRKVRATVKIPPEFVGINEVLTVTPDEVEEAFVRANPGLPRDAMAVTCDSRRLSEVRICVAKDFRFRACPDIDARACRRDNVVMPPIRQGSAALAR